MILACILLLSYGIEGSWLYQKVATDLQVGTSYSSSVPTNFISGPIHKEALRLQPKWSNGVRVTGFAQLPEGFDLGVYYSFYSTGTQREWHGLATPDPFNLELDIGNIVLPPLSTFSSQTPLTLITHINSFYKMRLQQYGLTCGYSVECLPGLVAKPYAGVKGVLLEQEIFSQYTWVLFNTQEFIDRLDGAHPTRRWNSVGPCCGLLAAYGDKVQVFGNFEVALLSTLYLEGTVGIVYSPLPNAALKLAWETQTFLKQNVERSSNLSLYGITLSLIIKIP